LELQKAFEYTKDKRTVVHPNQGFIHQLIMYQGMLNIVNEEEAIEESQQSSLEIRDYKYFN
jgi:hypothetical protein